MLQRRRFSCIYVVHAVLWDTAYIGMNARDLPDRMIIDREQCEWSDKWERSVGYQSFGQIKVKVDSFNWRFSFYRWQSGWAHIYLLLCAILGWASIIKILQINGSDIKSQRCFFVIRLWDKDLIRLLSTVLVFKKKLVIY